MKAIEEGAEVGVAEDGIIPGGEEVTTGEVLLLDSKASTVFPTDRYLMIAQRGEDNEVAQPWEWTFHPISVTENGLCH